MEIELQNKILGKRYGKRMHEMDASANAEASKGGSGSSGNVRVSETTEVDSRSVGIRNGRFNDGIYIAKVTGYDAGMKELKATASKTSRTRSVNDL